MAVDQRGDVVHRSVAGASMQLRTLSDFLWSNPEVGRAETKAHDALTALLRDLGFEVRPNLAGGTGFAACYPPGSLARPHVVLLCEYDALPSVGHACGHNLIAVVAVGAGVAVREALQAEPSVSGRVTVLGTPAEENDGGKIDFLDAGFFADVDAALMAHPSGGEADVVNPHMAGCDDFAVTFHGRAAHAAGKPWDGANALDAAVAAYSNVALLRQLLPPGVRVPGIIVDGGAVPNVIPDRTEMRFSLRARSNAGMADLRRRWRACVEAAATATDCAVDVDELGRDYQPLEANVALCRAFRAHADAAGLATKWSDEVAGSTDAGNVSRMVPTLHPFFCIGSTADCHQRAFADDAGGERAFQAALQYAELLALTAMDVLADPILRMEMDRELTRRTRTRQETGED